MKIGDSHTRTVYVVQARITSTSGAIKGPWIDDGEYAVASIAVEKTDSYSCDTRIIQRTITEAEVFP